MKKYNKVFLVIAILLVVFLFMMLTSGCDSDYGITKYEYYKYKPEILIEANVDQNYIDTAVKLNVSIEERNKIQYSLSNNARITNQNAGDKNNLYKEFARINENIKALTGLLKDQESFYKIQVQNAIRRRYGQPEQTK